VRATASIQETNLDVVWIRDGIVCLGRRSAERCYRAVLAVQAPPEAFAPEAERVQPLLDGFAHFLNALSQPGVLGPASLQALVRAEPADLNAYAARLEKRAAALPAHLALEALADASWARQKGAGLGLLDRRSYLVVPAETMATGDLVSRLDRVRPRAAGWFRRSPALDEGAARQALDLRCAELIVRLERCGVWSERLGDPELARLFHACWSRGRRGRFEQDLQTWAGQLPGESRDAPATT
jgi:hypothetical protein